MGQGFKLKEENSHDRSYKVMDIKFLYDNSLVTILSFKISKFFFRGQRLVNSIICVGPNIFVTKSRTHTNEDNSMMLHVTFFNCDLHIQKEFQHGNHNHKKFSASSPLPSLSVMIFVLAYSIFKQGSCP